MVDKIPVGPGRRVMEFVDDNVVEVIRCKPVQVAHLAQGHD